MILVLENEISFSSIYDFINSINGAIEWYVKKHPDYDGEDPVNVENFESDTDEIANYYLEKEAVYNVFYDDDSDCIVVQQLVGIEGRRN